MKTTDDMTHFIWFHRFAFTLWSQWCRVAAWPRSDGGNHRGLHGIHVASVEIAHVGILFAGAARATGYFRRGNRTGRNVWWKANVQGMLPA